jgi:hypothetical protein
LNEKNGKIMIMIERKGEIELKKKAIIERKKENEESTLK